MKKGSWRMQTSEHHERSRRIGDLIFSELAIFFCIPEMLYHSNRNETFFCHQGLIPLNSLVDIGMSQDVFAEVRRHKESSDKYKSENYNVLEAVDEIIRSTKGVASYVPSPVEYFSCLMSTLTQDTERRRSVWFFFCLIMFSCFIFFRSFCREYLIMSSV